MKPSRKDIQKKQKRLSQLQKTASLEPFLLAEEQRKLRLIITANRSIRILGGSSDGKTTDPGMIDSTYKLYASILGATARDVGADKIYEAKAEYEEEFQKAVDESLKGIEEGNITSLVSHFEVFGFELFGDPAIQKAAQGWWYGALHGLKEDKIRLKAILAALQKASSGRSKKLPSREEAEEIAEACEYWHRICEVLSAFQNKLRNHPRWQTLSNQEREAGRKKLVTEHCGVSASVEEGEIAWRYLIGSAMAVTTTPWRATVEIVADEHPIAKKYGLSPGTVEKIWQEFKPEPFLTQHPTPDH